MMLGSGGSRTSKERRRKLSAGLVASALGLTLQACSSIIELPGSGPAPSIYDLSIPADLPPPAVEHKWTLHVERPSAPRALETDRIALRPSAIELKYFKGARWSDLAPKMLQTLLAEAINEMGIIDPVSQGSGASSARYSVAGTLLAYEALYGGGSAQNITVVVKLRLIVKDRVGSRTIAHKTYTKSERVSRDAVESVVRAFDSATSALVAEAVPWIIETVEAKAAEKGARKIDVSQNSTN